MDSFELSTDSYNPAELRARRRRPLQPEERGQMELEDISVSRPVTPSDDDIAPVRKTAEETPRPAVRRPARRKTQTPSETKARPKVEEVPEKEEQPQPSAARNIRAKARELVAGQTITAPSVRQIFADGRFAIFFGVVMILLAAYMLVASISYIANASADQSLLVQSSADLLKNRAEDLKNTTGWFGAMLSHFLVYRWMGIGAFIIIFYVAAIGLKLVKLCKFNFWSLTFKSLISTIAVSIIAGLLTFSSNSPTFWGGEHGCYINKILIDNASLWSAIAVSVAMLTALILIFIRPLAFVFTKLAGWLGSIRDNLARRHDASIEAAHRTEMRQKAEMEAERRRVVREEQTKAAAEAAETNRDDLPEPMPKPVPLDEIYSPLTPLTATPAAAAKPSEPASVTELTDFTTASAEPAVTDEKPLFVMGNEPDVVLTETVADSDRDIIDSPELTDINPADSVSSDEAETTPEVIEDSIKLEDIPEIPADEEKEPAAGKITAAPLSLSLSIDSDATMTELAPENADEELVRDEYAVTADAPATTVEVTTVEATPIEKAEKIDTNSYDPTAELSRFKFPSIELLNDIADSGPTVDEEEQEANKQKITNILLSYGVEIASIRATIGPTITLYEIVPAPGVRIAKIKRLGDDVALNLSAMGIRIIAPIPGKGTIGMEVPNKKPRVVSIRSILSSRPYRESKAQLPMALGTTISNDVYVADLAKMPHLLVAGATGMGKSVGLNTIIASLLYRKHPAELKFVLVDPKMVEFSLYKCLERHYLAKLPDEESAIITKPENVVATLNSLCREMDDRYELLSDAGMRGIKEYNEKFVSRRLNPEKGHRYLPYIVVIIDEFADLILTVGKDVETPISRIAAKARAVGIHMILATQRPSVNVITGVIKANFPGRMAFRVTQRNDSQTILDRPGAEQLVGRGDMLISRDGIIDRVQCAFIDTPEVEAICEHISSQQGYPMAYELPEVTAAGDGSATGNPLGERDPLFPEAGREVIGQGIGSTSSLQRKFNIGYPRAGKIMDQLEMAGVVGPTQGGKPRAVLMDMYSFERYLES